MHMTRVFKQALLLFVVLSLTVVTAQGQGTRAPANAPPDEVQGQSFSIGRNSPLTAAGVRPADILGAGGTVLIPCENLGLLCQDPTTDTTDDIVGLSYGQDFADFATDSLPPLQFSVATGSRGLPNSAVRAEADCTPAQPQADAFETALSGTNSQDLDGDGISCSSNIGLGLGLQEGTSADNLDALARDPCHTIDLDCDGFPDVLLFLTLAPDSPTLALIGANATDILITGVEFAPAVWADGTTDLGLTDTDVIDAICVSDDGNGVYDGADQVLFSLTPDSPTLATLAASGADLLRPSPLQVVFAAATLGLDDADNVDALTCTKEMHFTDLYLPRIGKE